MATTVYFNGSVLSVPGAYSIIDTSGLRTKSSADGAKTLALIGECTGGEPGAVQFFSEPIIARRTLKGGELLKACEKAWNPVTSTKEGVEVGGANIIAVIRSNNATKSKLEIIKDNPDKPQFVFQSKDWGANTNYQIKIQDGTAESTKLITIHNQTDDTYESFDNLGRLFSIGYIGDQPYAELNIFRDSEGVMWFQTKIGEDAASAEEDLKISLNRNIYKTMRAFVLDLQSYENYRVVSALRYNMRITVADLDFVTGKDIKSTELNPTYAVTAVYADIAQYLQTNSRLIEVLSFDRSQGEIENIENYEFLTGGEEGTSPASWIKYFDQLGNFDIDYIVPLTADISIHAELAEHVNTCSGIMGRERRGVVGGNVGETVSETIQRSRDLNSSRIQVVHGGFYDINAYSEPELYPPYILAAQHAGRVTFLPDGESATHDVYRMSAPEYKLESNEITQLLQGGCLAFEYVIQGNSTASQFVRLVQDLTTDLMNDDAVHVERATGQLADSLNKEIRQGLDSMLTGKRTSLTDLVSAKNRVISILQERQRAGYIISFKDVYVVKEGGVTTVDYSVAAAEPNNFILITAHYYSETLTA